MSIGTQKHTPELIDRWLQGKAWDYPQDDWLAARMQGWDVLLARNEKRVVAALCLKESSKQRYFHLFNSDKEALDWVVSRAISGNALAIKALCYLSHYNPSEYGHWGKLLKGMYGKEKVNG